MDRNRLEQNGSERKHETDRNGSERKREMDRNGSERKRETDRNGSERNGSERKRGAKDGLRDGGTGLEPLWLGPKVDGLRAWFGLRNLTACGRRRPEPFGSVDGLRAEVDGLRVTGEGFGLRVKVDGLRDRIGSRSRLKIRKSPKSEIQSRPSFSRVMAIRYRQSGTHSNICSILMKLGPQVDFGLF